MPQTPRGIVYPGSAEHTRLWDHLQALADSVEAAVDALETQLAARDTEIEGYIAQRPKFYRGNGNYTTNANGDGSIPISSPNGAPTHAFLQNLSGALGLTLIVTGTTSTAITFRARGSSGAVVASTTIGIAWLAVV